MLTIQNYVKAKTLDEAYELNQARNSRVMGGMMWMRLGNARVKTVIDLSELELNKIEETDHVFKIGAMCTLRQLETHQGLNEYSKGNIALLFPKIWNVLFSSISYLSFTILVIVVTLVVVSKLPFSFLKYLSS